MQLFILHLFGGQATSGDLPGGSVTALDLATEWSKNGHEVHFITNDSDSRRSDPDSRVHVVSFSHGARHPHGESKVEFALDGLIPWPTPPAGLVSYVQGRLSDPHRAAVIAGSPFAPDLVGALSIARACGLRGVVYLHHVPPPPWWHPFRRGGLTRAITIWLIGIQALALTKIRRLVPSVDHPSALNATPWRFRYGIIADEGYVPQPLAEYPLVSDPGRVQAACFVSRVAENKGVMDLLQVWRLVHDALPGERLVIAGRVLRPRFGRAVVQQIRRLGLTDCVELVGYLSQPAKRALLRRSKLFVFPSYEEGWSLSVMEAAAFGALPVVYDLGAYEYLGEEAVRIPPTRVKLMARSIVALLRDDTGRQLRAQQVQARVTRSNLASIAEAQLIEIARHLGLPAVTKTLSG